MGWLNVPRRWALGLWSGGLLLSAAAGWWAHDAEQERITERLQTDAAEIAQRIEERFRQYEYGLRGARGAVVAAGGEAISRAPFEAYVATRDLAAEFPGARGFGFIRRVGRDALATFETAARLEGPIDFRVREIAPHDGDHFVIQYIYPLSENAGATGLDIASEAKRREAAIASAREGRAQLTAPITLVQASGLSRRGLLFLLPVYRAAQGGTPDARWRETIGWTYAPLVVDEVLADLGPRLTEVVLTLTDAADPEPFFERAGGPLAEAGMVPAVTRQMAIHGRQWTLTARPTRALVESVAGLSPWLVAAYGAVLATALAGLAFLLATRRHAQPVDEVAETLQSGTGRRLPLGPRRFLQSALARNAIGLGLIGSALAFAVGYHFELQHQMATAQATLDAAAQTFAQTTQSQRAFRRRNVQFLAATPPVQGMVRAMENMGLDPEGESTLRQWERRLQQVFVAYMNTTPDVHQIRFIALNDRGRELVRVERRGDRVSVEPSMRLQIKGTPDYVAETLKLGAGGVFVSDFDLYRENGNVVFPHRPTVRYATPVFNDDGLPVGLIMINVDRGAAVREFPGRTPPGASLILTNATGDYVLHPDGSLEFGFDLGQRRRWSDDHTALPPFEEGGAPLWQGPQGRLLVGMAEARANADTDIGTLRFHFTMPEAQVRALARKQVAARLPLAGAAALMALVVLYLYWLSGQRREEVRNQRLRLAAIVEQTNDAIIGLDREGRVTSWNRGAQQLFGYGPQEAVGRDMASLVVPEGDTDDGLTGLTDPRSTEPVPRVERWLRTRDGRLVEVAITLSSLQVREGVAAGASAIIRDITQERATQRRVAELNAHLEEEVRQRTASLSAERERLDNIIRGTNSGTWEWNVRTGERRYNERWAGMLGYTLAELGTLPGATWAEMVHPEDKELSSAALRRHFSGEIDQYECELRLRHRDGHWVWVLDRGRVITWTPEGQPEWMYGTHRDITAAKQAQQRLAANEELLRRTGHVAGVGGWQFDLTDWSVRWTPQVYAIHEVDADFPVSPETPLDFYPGEGRKAVRQALRLARKEAQSFDFEVPFRTAKGRDLLVRVVGEPVLDEAGRVVQIVGAIQDVTDRHAMETELRRINERQHSILENMPCAISAFDSDLRLVAWNTEFVRLLDLGGLFVHGVPTFEDIIRYNALRGEYGDGDVDALVAQAISRARNPVPHRFERVRPNGKPLEVRGTPMPGGGFVTTYTDMSERKLAEQAIARNANLLRGAIDAVDEAFVLFDPDDRLVFCNEKYRSLYKDVRDLLVPGTPFETIIRASGERGQNPAARGRVEAYVAERMAVHRRSNTTFVQTLADGRVIRVIENRMPDGHTVGFRIDITDLVRATEAAEAASRAKGEFLANMSHEIRTPLHAVIGLSHLLADTPLTTRQQQLLAKSQMASQSLLGIVNDVLDMAKIEAGALTLEDAPFSPAALLAELDAVFRQQAEAKGLRLQVLPAANLPPLVRGDALRLRQVFTNLLGNALKFTARGHVDVTWQALDTDAAGTRVRLRGEVIDSGEGITPEAQARLFTPFSQADASTSRRHGGTGLGLSIVRRLIEMMGGTLGLESAPGEGSRFWFELPLQRADADDPAAGSGALEVLVVDDVPDERQALVDMARAFGWRTEVCDSAASLLALIEQRVANDQPLPDAMLVDWQMQGADGRGMDGLQALAVLSERLGLARLPAALMVSASERERVARQDHLRLADDILTKPVNASVLFNAVNQGVVSRHGHSDRLLQTQRQRIDAGQALPGVRVLVVDDSEINQEIAQHMLVREGAQVYLAANGREALAVLRELAPAVDVVLMDVQMPEMDGLQATREMRADETLRALPVIALTAGALAEERRRAMEAGMDNFLTKPLDPALLVAAVRTQIERRTGQPLAMAPSQQARPDAPPPDWPVIDGIDGLQAARRLGNDLALLRRSLRRLIDEFAPMTDEPWPEWMDDGVRLALAARVHKLRGAAGLVDAGSLHQWAGLLENGLRDGLAPAALAPHWTELQAALRRLRLASADWLARSDAPAAAPDPAVPAATDDEVAQLAGLLSHHDLDALALFESQAPALRRRLGDDTLQRLTTLVEALDFDAAAALLAQEVTR